MVQQVQLNSDWDWWVSGVDEEIKVVSRHVVDTQRALLALQVQATVVELRRQNVRNAGIGQPSMNGGSESGGSEIGAEINRNAGGTTLLHVAGMRIAVGNSNGIGERNSSSA